MLEGNSPGMGSVSGFHWIWFITQVGSEVSRHGIHISCRLWGERPHDQLEHPALPAYTSNSPNEQVELMVAPVQNQPVIKP